MNKLKTELTEKDITSGKYHLIGGLFCPFAHRAIIAREYLGLEDHISFDITSPVNKEAGLDFDNHENGVDTFYGMEKLIDIYKNTDPEFDARPTVPVLVDKESKKIVNKESAEILREFATTFKSLHAEGAGDLYPENLRSEIDKWADFVGTRINSAVYRIGFATEQEVYEKEFNSFFEALDTIEEHLAKNRFFAGSQITEVDVKFYTTMVRFDEVYFSLYKANKKRLTEYHNIWNYMKELYQTKGFGSTTDFEQIRKGYYLGFGGAKVLAHTSVFPLGSDTSKWNEAHDRDSL
ncbi:MAG: glutathione S-transferase C-terminal domain-containing protein [Gemella sp.]|nr:glutathione S-transferase C-terminal domain-containing protein [Gemella sp.]